MQPANPLEEVLRAARTDPAARPVFYRLLLESPLYAVLAENAPNPDTKGIVRVAGDHEILRLQAMDVNGTPHIAVFTSEQALGSVLQEQRQMVSLVGRDLLISLRAAHLMLNPGSPYGKPMSPAEIEAILDGSLLGAAAHAVPAGTRIRLGLPAQYPQALVDALTAFFKKTKQVRAAYLALLHEPDSSVPPHIVVGVEHDGSWDELFRGIAGVIEGVPCENPPIDFVPMGDGVIPRYLKAETKPFFKRRLLGIF